MRMRHIEICGLLGSKLFFHIISPINGTIFEEKKLLKTEPGPHSSKILVLFYVLFVLCRSVYCLCVNVYCTTATGWQPNCS